MSAFCAPARAAEIQRRHGFRAAKSLGQNFLTDANVVARIVEGAGVGADDTVIEIGAGMGVLTSALAAKADRVVAIETDARLLPILEETLSDHANVRIVHADVMKTDMTRLLELNGFARGQKNQDGKKAKIVGNLPYYITTPVIMRLLEADLPVESLTFMMQKEVADRLRAEPGGKGCGAVTVAVRYRCEVFAVMNVSREVFMPKPNVDSTVLRLDIRKEKAVSPSDEGLFFAVVRAGFGQRRKTLLNALTGVAGLSKTDAGRALAAAGIDSARRAETLDLAAFAAVADAFRATQKGSRIE